MSEQTFDLRYLRGGWILSYESAYLLSFSSKGPALVSKSENEVVLVMEPVPIGDPGEVIDESAPLQVRMKSMRGAKLEGKATYYYWSYNGSQWESNTDPTNATVFQIEGSQESLTLEVLGGTDSQYLSVDMDAGTPTVAVGSSPTSFVLVGRVPTTYDPLDYLLPGEVRVFENKEYGGNSLLWLGSNTGAVGMILGPNAKGSLAFPAVNSVKVGPQTSVLDNNYTYPQQFCFSCDTPDLSNPDGNQYFKNGITTQVGIRDRFEGTWALTVGTKMLDHINGTQLALKDAPTETGAPDSLWGLFDIDLLYFAQPDMGENANEQNIYRLSLNGQQLAADPSSDLLNMPVLATGEEFPTSGLYLTSDTTDPNLLTFKINVEGPGLVSFESIETGEFISVDGNEFLVMDAEASQRLVIETRFRSGFSTSMGTSGQTQSRFRSVMGYLNPGEVAFFSEVQYGLVNGMGGRMFNHDLKGISLLTGDPASIQVGPETTVTLYDNSGTKLGQYSNSSGNCLVQLSGAESISIIRNIPPIAPGGKTIKVTNKLITDYVLNSGEFGTESAYWRTVIALYDEKGANLPLEPIYIQFDNQDKLLDTDYDPVNTIYCEGVGHDISDQEIDSLTTDYYGKLTLYIPAPDLLVTPLRIRLDGMDPGEGMMIYPDQDLHEILLSISGDDLRKGTQQTNLQEGKPSPFADALDGKEDEANEFAEALQAAASTINYENGNATFDSKQLQSDDPNMSLAHAHWRNPASRLIKPHTRNISGRRAKHKHWSFHLEGEAGERFRSHTTGAEALAHFYQRRHASALPIEHIPLTNLSLSSWWASEWSGVKDFVVTTVEEIVEVAEEVVDEVTEVVEDVVETVQVAWAFVEDGIQKIATMVLEAVDDVMGLVRSIFNALSNAWQDIVNFLSYVFNWGSMVTMASNITNTINGGIDLLQDEIDHVGTVLNSYIESAESIVNDKLTEFIENLGGEGVSPLPLDTKTQEDDESQGEDNWLFSKFNESIGMDSDGDPNDLFTGIEDVITDFVDKMIAWTGTLPPPQNGDFSLEDVMNNIIDEISNELGAIDSAEAVLVLFLKALQKIVQLLAIVAESFVDLGITLINGMIQEMQDMLNYELNIPIFSDLFEEITKAGGAPTGLALTPLNLISLMIAIPVTIMDNTIDYIGQEEIVLSEGGLTTRQSGLVIGTIYVLKAFISPISDIMAVVTSSIPATKGGKLFEKLAKMTVGGLADFFNLMTGINPLLSLIQTTIRLMTAGGEQPVNFLVLKYCRLGVGLAYIFVVPPIAKRAGTTAGPIIASVMGAIIYGLDIGKMLTSETDAGVMDSGADAFNSIAKMAKALRAEKVIEGTEGISLAILLGVDSLANLAAAGTAYANAILNSPQD